MYNQPGNQGIPNQGYPPGYNPQQQQQQPQRGYPGQQQPSQQGYAPQQQHGYPPQGQQQSPQQGYPGQQPQQGYPPQQQPHQGYPQQQHPQQGYPPQGQGYNTQQGQSPLAGWAAGYYSQVNPQEIQALSQWFQRVDQDRSGSITSNELANVTFGSAPIGIGVANKLIKVFDKDHSGSIDFKEYVALHQFLNVMQQAFYAGDSDRSGTLDSREIHAAFQTGGFQLSFQTINAVCLKFSPTGAGINFATFLYICAHLAHCRSIFEWNDTSRSGMISFNFDALCHVATDILP